jgi:hypothetical protein
VADVPEQYVRLLAAAEDASDLEPAWQEWHTVFQETRQKMAELGMDLIEVIVDYDEMGPGDLAVVNRFLKELGSTQQLEDE